MDIDLLSKMVRELVLDNDKVALPGLGTFVAELIPASFSDKGYTINPPYRRLSFRPSGEDDGLLANLYSESNGVGSDVAARIIGDFVAEMKDVLKAKKVVVFPDLGRLRATRENNFFFVPDEDLDIYPEGFGLAPVSLKTHKETKEDLSAAVEELKSMIDTPSPAEPQAQPEMSQPETPQTETPAPEVPQDESIQPADDAEAAPQDETSHQDESAEIRENAEKPAAKQETDGGSKTARRKKILLAIFVPIAAILLLLVLYILVARLNPQFFDSILYDQEQLEILNSADK